MIKAVFFDIDETLYSYDYAHGIAMKALEDWMYTIHFVNRTVFRKVYEDTMRTIVKRTRSDCAANHNRLIRFQCILDTLGIQKPSVAVEMYHLYWGTLIASMKPEPGAIELVKELRRRQILLGVGTDMTAYIQYKKLEKLGILDDMSMLVTSEESGAEKPDEHLFALCVEKAGCRPEECVFIGDSLRKDVKGAADYGMYGIWYRPHPKDGDADCGYPMIQSYLDCMKDGRILLGQRETSV